MTAVDWLWILHPFMAVVLIYPLIGMVLRLGVQTRARRQKTNPKLPPSVGRSHSDLGRWLAGGVVVIVLIALTVSIGTKRPLPTSTVVPPELPSCCWCCSAQP